MKQFTIIISILLFQNTAWATNIAQQEVHEYDTIDTIDTTAWSKTLGEVVVKADRVFKKIDRQVILPSKQQVEASGDGLVLLQNLKLNRIVVNPIDKTVKTIANEEVQLRINGVTATMEEILAIRPEEVKKVEYHDNPSLRYGQVAAVIDYIVRHKEDGGNFNLNLSNGISKQGWGEYQLGGKYNHGKSSLQLLGHWGRRKLTWTRENYESFVYLDTIMSNVDLGNPTRAQYDNTMASLTYNYTDGDRQLFNITFNNRYNNTPAAMSDRSSTLHQGSDIYHIIDHEHSWEEIPSLDVYCQRSIGHNQHLYLDLVGTLMSSDIKRQYQSVFERDTTTIGSHVKGSKQSLIGEAIYEKQFTSGRLTAGVKHTQSHVGNTYLSDWQTRTRMNSAETYGFAEYQAMLGTKLNYVVGMGLMRTYNSQENESDEKYILRPTFSISYEPAHNVFLRYKFYVSGYSPSLSQLSDVTQGIDVYQSRRGNPNLKSVTYYANSLTASWKNDFMGINLWGSYSYDHKPVMDETNFEDGMFIRTFNNQKGFHRIMTNATFQFFPLGEYLQVSLTPFFNRYISQGNTYTHTFNNWGFYGNLQLLWGHWTAYTELRTRQNSLWGEEIKYGEKMDVIGVGYNTKKWSANLNMIMPFTKHYSIRVENISQLAPYTLKAFSNMFSHFLILNVSLNLDFGKQVQHVGKRINNTDTDNGVLSGTK